jgi:hypothetical protein
MDRNGRVWSGFVRVWPGFVRGAPLNYCLSGFDGARWLNLDRGHSARTSPGQGGSCVWTGVKLAGHTTHWRGRDSPASARGSSHLGLFGTHATQRTPHTTHHAGVAGSRRPVVEGVRVCPSASGLLPKPHSPRRTQLTIHHTPHTTPQTPDTTRHTLRITHHMPHVGHNAPHTAHWRGRGSPASGRGNPCLMALRPGGCGRPR